jgi:hypothetical protein
MYSLISYNKKLQINNLRKYIYSNLRLGLEWLELG